MQHHLKLNDGNDVAIVDGVIPKLIVLTSWAERRRIGRVLGRERRRQLQIQASLVAAQPQTTASMRAEVIQARKMHCKNKQTHRTITHVIHA